MEPKQAAQLLRNKMADKKPPLKVREVQEILGLSSTSAAEIALWKMQEAGEVIWVASGKKGYGTWYLV